MSFKQNDRNNMIHLGNYEAFFILYMDQELSDVQMKMVDEFLLAHPDLQGEFELLMSTKLPMEEISFEKQGLYAEHMDHSPLDEDLLLYIDEELATDKKNVLELELAANADYRRRHGLLLKAKLDPSETIACPNRELLYHHTERVVFFKPWMRIAAGLILVAGLGSLYFMNENKGDHLGGAIASTGDQPKTEKAATNGAVKPDVKNNELPLTGVQQSTAAISSQAKATIGSKSETNKSEKGSLKNSNTVPANGNQDQGQNLADLRRDNRDDLIETDFDGSPISVAHKGSINISPVTSVLSERNNIKATKPEKTVTPDKEDYDGDVASNKGSVKGFLRKATRLIEKKTGVDPTNDGELLIGVVAVKLK